MGRGVSGHARGGKKSKGKKKHNSNNAHIQKCTHERACEGGKSAGGDIVTSMYTSNKNITYTQKKSQAEHVKSLTSAGWSLCGGGWSLRGGGCGRNRSGDGGGDGGDGGAPGSWVLNHLRSSCRRRVDMICNNNNNNNNNNGTQMAREGYSDEHVHVK